MDNGNRNFDFFYLPSVGQAICRIYQSAFALHVILTKPKRMHMVFLNNETQMDSSNTFRDSVKNIEIVSFSQ